ncbi:MAG: DUF4276 family protein [Terracidiphilus sp.]|jgi:hypothetical protein
MLEKLIVLVEEESAEAALFTLLPKLLPESQFQIIRFQGKQNMLRNLPTRLRGFASWLPENWSILVLIDRDNDDCMKLKRRLEVMVQDARLSTKSSVQAGARFQVALRIVVEELESWFFGDWEAVRAGYPRVSATIPNKERFRIPDEISGGTWEAMEQILQSAGYYKSGLSKIELARTVAQHMDPARNKSYSFKIFHEAIIAAAGV